MIIDDYWIGSDWFNPVHPLTSLEIFAECLGMLKWIAVGPWKLGNQK
jgi:hypothetical protein